MKSEKLRGFIKYFSYCFGFFLLVIAFNVYIMSPLIISGSSMEPTLQNGNFTLLNKLPRTWANLTNSRYIPKRGDIVVVNKKSNFMEEQIVKRVVAVSGERVLIRDGSLRVFSTTHPEGINPDEGLGLDYTEGNVDYTVPDGEVYLVGDNRTFGGSIDSRSSYGSFKSEDVIGKVKVRIIPPLKFF